MADPVRTHFAAVTRADRLDRARRVGPNVVEVV